LDAEQKGYFKLPSQIVPLFPQQNSNSKISIKLHSNLYLFRKLCNPTLKFGRETNSTNLSRVKVSTSAATIRASKIMARDSSQETLLETTIPTQMVLI